VLFGILVTFDTRSDTGDPDHFPHQSATFTIIRVVGVLRVRGHPGPIEHVHFASDQPHDRDLQAAAQLVVEDVVEVLARSSPSSMRIRTRNGPIKRGTVQTRPITQKGSKTLRSACRVCGLILDDPDRHICDECLPEFDRERTARLSQMGKARLAAMRASNEDPAHSAAAREKRAQKSRATSSAMRAWEREHGRGDPKTYEREILPRIQAMTVPHLMRLTGLSQFHCWKVRMGERRLHARHWEAVMDVTN
jgi:hypothetical protein